MLFLILFAASLPKCGTITIHNAEWCGDRGNEGASCFHTNTEDFRRLNKAEWDAERFGQLCTKSENYADLEAALQKLCEKTNSCNFTEDERQKIENFFSKIRQFRIETGQLNEP